MKKIITGDLLTKKMIQSINLLCDCVISSLGPTGNNILINTNDTTPFITKDGVTIASSIVSNDICINTILEIIKEASFKTNENMGDGTTTTLCLLKHLFLNGLNELNNKKIINFEDQFTKTLNDIIKKIKLESRKPSLNDLVKIATVSAKSKEIGSLIARVFNKIQNKYAIRLVESPNEKSYYVMQKGYNIEIRKIPNIYLINQNQINLKDIYILIINGYLNDLSNLESIINEALNNNRNLLIICEDYSDMVEQEINELFLLKQNIYLTSLYDYAYQNLAIYEDIKALTNALIKFENEKIDWQDLGYASKVIINDKEILVINKAKNLHKRINFLNQKIKNTQNTYEKEILENSKAKLLKGTAIIYIGGITKTEIKEKIMRAEDALNAIESAKNGICLGSGIPYLKISEQMQIKTSIDKIFKEALKKPFYQIMNNANLNANEIAKNIINSNYQVIYNINNKRYENINNTYVLDSKDVLISALKNACSISIILITTKYLVVNTHNNLSFNNQEL